MAQRCLSCMQMLDGGDCPHCGYPTKVMNESHQLAVGTMLRKRYQIGRCLGQGGFGITYLGWDTLMRKTVAVKEFYPSGAVYRRTAVSAQVECVTDAMIPHFEYSRERFLREASALVDFKDIPEVVDILDFIEENNTAYIVMEYVRGVDLAKYIQMKGGRLSIDETFRILRPVMDALAKVHKGGIVHRDISPDNIILDPMGGAKLLDFGAVRTVEDPDVDKRLNKSTEAILKHGFAPIEQYNTRGGLGPWTDEYAMCATVWYCLTGSIPEEASIRMSEGIDPDWSAIPGLPEHQQRALEKGFACRARDRYRSLDELLADLFPVTAAKEVHIPLPSPAKEEPGKAAKARSKAPQERGKQIWTAVAITVLAVLLAVAVLLPKGIKTVPEESISAQIQTQPTTEATESSTAPPNPEEEAYAHAETLLSEGKLGEAAIAFADLAEYADARERSFAIWDKIAVRDTVALSYQHSVGLRVDGTIVAKGISFDDQRAVSDWPDIVAVSAGMYHTVGLRPDGTVVATGQGHYYHNGPCDVDGWRDIVAISAGEYHTVGLKANGTVFAVGRDHHDSDHGQCAVNDWTDIVAISAGDRHTVGLKVDGTVVAAGDNYYGQCDVGGWTDIVAIRAGDLYTVGLRADGTVVAVGEGTGALSGWTDIVAISACSIHIMGLRANGTVVVTGTDHDCQFNANGWTNIVAINAGGSRVIGLKADGTVVTIQQDIHWTDIMLPTERVPFR